MSTNTYPPILRLDKRKIRIALIDSDMTIPQIAQRMGVTRQTIYNALNGRNASLSTVSEIAAALGVDPISILKTEE
jgi:transcriptional regulator with XRE-family HTH domain